jgi:hypothetical protein
MKANADNLTKPRWFRALTTLGRILHPAHWFGSRKPLPTVQPAPSTSGSIWKFSIFRPFVASILFFTTSAFLTGRHLVLADDTVVARTLFEGAMTILRDQMIVTFSRSGTLEYAPKGPQTNVVYYRAGRAGNAFFLDRNWSPPEMTHVPQRERIIFGRQRDGTYWRVELSRPYRDVVLHSRPEDNGGRTQYVEEIDAFASVIDQVCNLGIMMLIPGTLEWSSEESFSGASTTGGTISGRISKIENGRVARLDYELPMRPSWKCAVHYQYESNPSLPRGVPTGIRLYHEIGNEWSDLGGIDLLGYESVGNVAQDDPFLATTHLLRRPPDYEGPAILIETNKLLLELVAGGWEPVTAGRWRPPGSNPELWQRILLISVVATSFGFLLLRVWWGRRRQRTPTQP